MQGSSTEFVTVARVAPADMFASLSVDRQRSSLYCTHRLLVCGRPPAGLIPARAVRSRCASLGRSVLRRPVPMATSAAFDGPSRLSYRGPSPVLIAKTMGAAVAVVGLVVLAGWLLGVPALIRLGPGWVPMKANVALGLLL